MKKYLWYSSGTSETGEKLAKRLKVDHGTEVPNKTYDLIISWGARLPAKTKTSVLQRLARRNFINDVFAIETNADKFSALKKLSRTVSVPKAYKKSYLDRALAQDLIKFPCIARKKSHQGGSGLYICLQKSDCNYYNKHRGVDHYLEFIPNKSEYRVHVFDGVVVRVSKKVPDDTTSRWIKSRSRGWRMKDCSSNKISSVIKEECIKAVKTLRLDFGAVDLLVNSNKQHYILEVNTGMGLDRSGRDLYETLLRNKVNELES